MLLVPISTFFRPCLNFNGQCNGHPRTVPLKRLGASGSFQRNTSSPALHWEWKMKSSRPQCKSTEVSDGKSDSKYTVRIPLTFFLRGFELDLGGDVHRDADTRPTGSFCFTKWDFHSTFLSPRFGPQHPDRHNTRNAGSCSRKAL